MSLRRSAARGSGCSEGTFSIAPRGIAPAVVYGRSLARRAGPSLALHL
ncbi:hypothetical protein BRPE64_DCDS04270 (plasmid) [Caballeronia insecticola]|uniref:Uncharacterized protein n=1 Tax=Caballeronia insecticola TaxID=758793 RepID=R4WRT3_9BURK|nr:hypothetical protein BRPE64_DCDS04270 [Caballeronia insecticola]